MSRVSNQVVALAEANAPSTDNAYATIADVGVGGGLTNVVGTDAPTTMAVGNNYIVTPQTTFAANQTYTLPDPSGLSEGDEIGCQCLEDTTTKALIINWFGGTEWSRLLIKDEHVRFRVSGGAWTVYADGRIATYAQISADGTNAQTYAGAANDFIDNGNMPTVISNKGMVHDPGDRTTPVASTISSRRPGIFTAYAVARTNISNSDFYWKIQVLTSSNNVIGSNEHVIEATSSKNLSPPASGFITDSQNPVTIKSRVQSSAIGLGISHFPSTCYLYVSEILPS